MKKFIINILIFFGLMAVIDVAAGRVLWYLLSTKAGGGTGAEYHVCKQGDEDILIMGSSRASHHYVVNLFQEELGLSCFNGGQDGNGIIMQYGRWKMLSKRHVPKLIIYDVEPSFDLIKSDNTRFIDRLKPYAGDKDVKRYITSLYPLERIKLQSFLYRNNYKFLEILNDCIRPRALNGGYKPLYGHIRDEMINRPIGDKSSEQFYDEVKTSRLIDLILEAQASGSKIILVSSPYWKSVNTPDLSIIGDIAKEYGVPFINYSDSEICGEPELFSDSVHLNDDGAIVFTEDIIRKVKGLGI